MARIKVIIPCYNDGEFVTGAVDSIDQAEEVEVVIVDDGSSDAATAAVLEALEARGTASAGRRTTTRSSAAGQAAT